MKLLKNGYLIYFLCEILANQNVSPKSLLSLAEAHSGKKNKRLYGRTGICVSLSSPIKDDQKSKKCHGQNQRDSDEPLKI